MLKAYQIVKGSIEVDVNPKLAAYVDLVRMLIIVKQVSKNNTCINQNCQNIILLVFVVKTEDICKLGSYYYPSS